MILKEITFHWTMDGNGVGWDYVHYLNSMKSLEKIVIRSPAEKIDEIVEHLSDIWELSEVCNAPFAFSRSGAGDELVFTFIPSISLKN